MFDSLSDTNSTLDESLFSGNNSGLHLEPPDGLKLQSVNKHLSSPPTLGAFSQEKVDSKTFAFSGDDELMPLHASLSPQINENEKLGKSSVDALTGEGLSNSTDGIPITPIVEQAVKSAHGYLKGLAADSDFSAKMNLAFGESWNAEVASNLVQKFESGDFNALPAIEILPSAAINKANGAFASVTNTIYLSKEFVAENVGNPGAVASVLLEEIGHYIDSKVNVSDAAGDEGEIFAAIVQGKELSEGELLGLKAEDDTATISIGGKDISIEKSQIAMTSLADKLFESHRGLDNKIYTRFSTGFSPDGITWSQWKASGGTTNSAPSLEAFGNKLYQSHRGTDDKIYTRFSTSFSADEVLWSPWTPAEAPARTKNAIALEAFGNKLYQSHRGFDNKIYTRSSSDGVAWSSWTASDGETYSAPSLEAFGNKLYQSHRGKNDKIYTRSSSDGVNWSQWKESGGETYSTPDLEEFNGKLYQSHRGTDDKIYTRFSSDGNAWSQWKESGGETPTAPTLEALNDKLYQSHQGLNQKIYTRFSSNVAPNGEITWSPWKESGGESPLDRDDFSVIPTGEFNAEYYNNISLSGAPTLIRKESKVEKNWGNNGPGKTIANDNFSVRWTGKFNFDKGDYSFKVKADDGVRMWVDNKLVINQWKDQSPTEYSAKVNLSQGTHEVKVEYYEKIGGAEVKALWEKFKPSSNYQLPYPDSTKYRVSAGNDGHHTTGENALYNRYAWDFAMPEGSSVVAAKSGRIVSLYEGSQRNSYGEKNNGYLYNNYVVIDHGGGQSTLYAHLKFNSVIPKVGDWVEQNQKIAESGNTGNSEGPHLHYSVQKTPSKNYGNTSYGYWTESLASSFSDPDVLRQNPNGVPTRGKSYTS